MFQKNTSVVILSRDAFNGKKIRSKKQGIIFFGVPWCGYCRKAVPDYEKTAQMLKPHYTFYYVNCEENPDIAKKFNVKGYPTIKFVDKNGEIYKDYTGDRSVKSYLDTICIDSSICKKQ